MRIPRRFTAGLNSPYADQTFELRKSEIREPDGRIVFSQDNVIVPSEWSQVATDILAQKYFRKTGVPIGKGKKSDLTTGEHDARQVFHRLAGCWTDWGKRFGYFTSEEDAGHFYDELCYMLSHQIAAPNSPQWFNTGLYWAYGINGPAQGHFFVDPKAHKLKASDSAYEHPQPHACQPYGALVSTPKGPIPIGKIVEESLTGLEVYDRDGVARVVAVKKNGRKPVLRAVLENGNTLEATADHLVWVDLSNNGKVGTGAQEWLELGKLEPGMRLVQRVSTPIDDRPERGLQISEAVLVGWSQGDGFAGESDRGTNRSVTKEVSSHRLETVLRLEYLGEMDVYDIQTTSGNYLSGNFVVHNCFIQSVRDDLVNDSGIMDLWVREARLFKYGSGTGTNFSHLRGEGEPLSGGGQSSGLMSFLKVGDRAAGVIKSGGTTRRAAKMVCLDLDHPEIERFVSWKVLEEQKVAALVAGSRLHRKHVKAVMEACFDETGAVDTDPATNRRLARALRAARAVEIPDGYLAKAIALAKQGKRTLDFPLFDVDWQGEAYVTVSGQNSNNSVRVPNSFFDRLESGDTWHLTRRTDGSVCRELPARELWDTIGYATWASADPGIQCDTTINEWHTCPAGGRINASNPCSEYMFLDDTACNLASINLLKFYDDKSGEFRLQDFAHACRLWTIVLEISVLMAQYPSKAIAQNSFDYRTLGLGYANLGALLMSMGIPYGSPEALAICGALTALMTGEAYATSAEMAGELGPFAKFSANREAMLRVMRNHRRAAYHAPAAAYEGLSIAPLGIDESRGPVAFVAAAREAWDRAVALGEQHGYRNAQTTVIAPTGTIGLIMDCDTTGIEPDFALVKFKKLAGGGYFRIINQSVPRALKNLGYTPDEVKAIVSYCIGHGTLEGAPHINPASLKAKGFTDEALAKLARAVPFAFDLSFVFTPWTLGETFCRNELGIPEAELAAPDFELLRALGFSRGEIADANAFVFGTATIEGAPGLKPEHLPIFDCANKCGRLGRRFLDYRTHIDMMAAAQPFISGAISKTINMPNEATLEDVQTAFHSAWKKMVKAISIYRDGSKLSQPLSAMAVAEIFDHLGPEEGEVETPLVELPPAPESVPVALTEKQIEEIAASLARRSVRRELPGRRFGYTVKATIGGQRVYLRTGEYEDGRLGEIFVDVYKEGAAYRSLMNAFAIAVSLGLQYGVPLEEFVTKFHMFRFEPNGHVADHDNIKFCSSIIDFLFRDLALNYLGRTDLVHVPPADERTSVRATSAGGLQEVAPGPGSSPMSSDEGSDVALTQEEWSNELALASRLARERGYEGDPCSECGQFTMVRSGTCTRCVSCGSTSGCS